MRRFSGYASLLYVVLLVSACSGGGGSIGSVPNAPGFLTVVGGDGFTTISWANIRGATTYNLYWLTSSGVTQNNGNLITGVTSPLKHGGLVNGVTYYYVLTAVNPRGESGDSSESSDTPINGAGVVDPLYSDQWHLNNTGQLGNDAAPALAGEDINVEPVWNSCGTGNSCRGEGIRIAVVDDGLEIAHEDLSANVATGLSYNYLNGSDDPTPTNSTDSHGTRVSGIIAARDLNNLGVRGVAPRASIFNYNMLQNSTVSNESDAMIRGSPDVDISSNSWGPIDGYGIPIASSLTWRTAITNGLTNGRNGLGTIYVMAGGNGAPTDNSNYDGYVNNRGVITVAAVTDQGTQAFYSEDGANILVSAPGGDICSTHNISTTDLSGEDGSNNSATAGVTDYNDTNYTQCMNGTSAATPIVSGVVALMLQENPNLGWRDVRSILARSARVNDAADTDWSANGATLDINHKYGFGVVDADAAVTLASTWTNLGTEVSYASPLYIVNTAIPDFDTTGVIHTRTITGSGITEIESIEITFNSTDHTYVGDLEITLTNVATGTISQLSAEHGCVIPCEGYDGWVFSSVRHLGEAADGNWRLTVKDLAPVDTGTFQSWSLTFYGT